MFNPSELKLRRKAWLSASGIPKKKLGLELGDCTEIDTKVMDSVKTWINLVNAGRVIKTEGKQAGKGLLFLGKPGCGKTTLVNAIIQNLIKDSPISAFSVEEGHSLVKPCYFMTFNDLLNLKGRTMDDEPEEADIKLLSAIEGYNETDAFNIRVLIIDDVGNEHESQSQWQKNMLHHVFRTRYNAGLPTIVTSNIPLENWNKRYGDATASFVKEAFAVLPVVSAKGDLR